MSRRPLSGPLPRALVLGGLVLGASTVAWLLFVVDPATSRWFPPCPWRALTGWLCPGCGSTRALHALLHGDIVAAWHFNPLAMIALPVVSVDGVQSARGRPAMFTDRLRARHLYGLAAGLLLYGFARNL